MALAIPGGAPGYDYDKEDGNNVAHDAELASQRLREHRPDRPIVKAMHQRQRDFVSVARIFCFGERYFANAVVLGPPIHIRVPATPYLERMAALCVMIPE